MKNKRNILLCVAGMSPQIITETLFALTQNQKVKIDEIRVITTLDGKNKVANTLLDKENGVFYKFCRDFNIDINSIKFDETCISLFHKRDGKMLEDIRTQEDNEIAGDKICEIVRELCKDENTRIYASAAGGRKTMSIYLTLAMSLFGRAEDELSHVLVNEGFESNTFFYPPPKPTEVNYFNPQTKITKKVNTADAKIYLAPIPFIRLRGIGKENQKFAEARNYGEIVDEAQKVLDIKEKEYDLIINIKKQSLFVRGEKIKLARREFFFYYIFIKKRLLGNVIFSIKDLAEQDFHDAFKEIIMETVNEDADWEEINNFPRYNFAEVMLDQLIFHRNFEKPEENRNKEYKLFRGEFSKVVTLIAKKFQAKGVDNRYYLVSTDDGTASYELKIDKNRIKFESN